MASSKLITTIMLIGIVALAATGCSDDSNPVNTTQPVDTAPPAVPTSLGAVNVSGAAVLSWDANTVDTDLAGFVIAREAYGQVQSLVATPQMITSYTDAAPVVGSATYRVYAVDTSGNQSPAAWVCFAISVEHVGGRNAY